MKKVRIRAAVTMLDEFELELEEEDDEEVDPDFVKEMVIDDLLLAGIDINDIEYDVFEI